MSRTYRKVNRFTRRIRSEGGNQLAFHLRYRVRDGQASVWRNSCGCWACDYCEANRTFKLERQQPLPYDEEE